MTDKEITIFMVHILKTKNVPNNKLSERKCEMKNSIAKVVLIYSFQSSVAIDIQ